ncbi:MAG: hypothetical protein JW772_05135 [Candidatus Diapherotrites archaeon]|nr:hypothetical protein [Candidatus Diapherotrites archaeon]
MKKSVLLVALVLAVVFSGCVDNPFGGCNGTYEIKDLSVTPAPDCLEFEANNCNDGVLVVTNDCQETIFLCGVEIPAATIRYYGENKNNGRSVPGGTTLEIILHADGSASLEKTSGNYAKYIPKKEQQLSITCDYKGKPITIAYLKVKKS